MNCSLFRLLALVFALPAAASAQVTITHGSFQWNQANTPNTGDEIIAGTFGGATFNVDSDDTTGNISFPDSVAGGAFDESFILSVLIGDEASGTRAVNLPFGANVGQDVSRRGIGVGWMPGTVGGAGAALTVPVLPNGPGIDFVIFESGDPMGPDALMVRVRVANGVGGPEFTPWFFASEVEETNGSPTLHAYAYDLTDFGLGSDAQIDRIELANMVGSDRINAVGTLNGAADPIDAKWSNVSSPFGGRHLEFDGDNDYGIFESNLFDVGSSGTLSYWVRLDDTGKRNQMFEGPGNAGLEFQYRSNGGGQFYGRAIDGADFVIESGGAASVNGNWVNMQYTWDSGTSEMRIYRDGSEVSYLAGFDQSLTGFPPVTDTTAGQMSVGRDPGDGARALHGGLDDIGWFNAVLNSTDRDNIRNNGVAALSADPRLVAHWPLDQTSGNVETDLKNSILLILDSVESWVAEGEVLPEAGMPFSMDNPGPDPGAFASFDIPFGNSTYDPDPLYVAALHDLEELSIPAPPVLEIPTVGTLGLWAMALLLALLGPLALRRP